MKYLNIILSALLPALAMPLMAQSLVINEMQVANIDSYLDPSCNYGSWFELYNPTSNDITLTDYIVRHTDADGVVSTKSLTANHGTVPAGGYKVLWCDHAQESGTYYDGALGEYDYTNADGTVVTLGNSALQMPFKLDTDGGTLEILTSNKAVLASYTYTAAVSIARCSWARTTDGGDIWSMTATPTPGRTNNTAQYATERLAAPVVDKTGNIFDTSVTLQVTIPAGQTLKYTTDGSAPSVINGNISAYGSFTVDTTTIFRLALFQDGKLPGQVITRSLIKKDRDYYLPVVSITGNPDVFFSNIQGVLIDGLNGVTDRGVDYPCNWNMDWERPANMELFEPNGGSYENKLNQEHDFQVSGGWSRPGGKWDAGGWTRRPSFRLEGSKQYEGVNSFDYPYLPAKQYNKYKTVQVRNGGNYHSADGRMREATTQEIIRRSGMYLDTQGWEPAHFFINGKYYGTMNIREASNKNYPYSNYGIDTDEMDAWENFFNMREGTNECGNNWLSYSNALASAPIEANWNRISDLVEIDEVNNYFAAYIYMGVTDWMDGNMKGFRARPDGKIHMNMFDTDLSFAHDSLITSVMDGTKTSNYAKIIRNMLKYPAYKQQFADTYCMMAGSIFEETRCSSIEVEMLDKVKKAISFEGATPVRYHSQRMSGKTARINNLKRALSLGDEYKVKVSSNIGSARLLLNGQEIPTNKFDGSLFGTITLTAKAPAGYTFLGWRMNTHTGSLKADAPAKVSSLRKSSGKGNSNEASGTTESYDGNSEIGIFDEIASTSETYTLTDEYEAGTFVLEAVYHKITDTDSRLAAGATPIRINEVSAGNDIYINDYFKKNDWVELYNTTDEAIDIAGMYLSDDRSNPRKYQIQAMTTDPSSLPTPQTTVIPAHGTRIIWCDGLTQQNQLHAPFKLSNADGAVASIMAADGSWQDVMEYKYQPRFCTYGRYPDGGNYACLMSRPTIDAANSILTQDFRAATEKEWASPDIAVTLGLFEGWNWTSHNMADPVQASLFMPNALCFRDQTDETIKDEVFGWVGNITTLKPTVGYKIKMSENTAITLRGNIFDKANTPVTVLKGWNWIGMPLYSPCMLTSFFCNYEATEGDCIQGQEGFATYSGGAWTGSLTEMTPGQAYLLKSGKAQQFNWPPVKDGNGTTESYSETDIDWSNAVTSFSATTESGSSSSNQSTDNAPQMTEQYASGNMDWNTSEKISRKETNRRYMCPLAAGESAGLWTCDIHAYPNVMSLIGELKVDDRLVSDSYTVAAFCGDECRGVAEVTDGKIYMNLHGDGGEDLTFKVCDNIGEQYPLDNAMTFTAQTLVGSMSEPYLFSLSTVTELSDADAMTIVNVEYFTLDGIRISAPGNGIYIKRITYRDGHVENVKTM